MLGTAALCDALVRSVVYKLSYLLTYLLGLDSLYCRRVNYDFTICYKMLNSLVCIDSDIFFRRSIACNTRDNSMSCLLYTSDAADE